MNKEFVVAPQDHGKRLLQFLRGKAISGYSVKALKRLIAGKRCLVNGKLETFATVFLSAGDKVLIQLEDAKQDSIKTVAILYEDDYLAICNKPPGIISDEKVLQKCLRKPWLLVHRLDKETSGVLILAKNSTIKEKMIELFEKKKVRKLYLAIVKGSVTKRRGTKDTFFAVKSKYAGQTVWGSASKGMRAITRWRCIKKGKEASLLFCEPVTGRTHQLRVHLAEMGHPVLGDAQYGRHVASTHEPHRHCLHALAIRFPHPITGKRVRAIAPLPDDMKTMAQSV